jgi:hypothetical protein
VSFASNVTAVKVSRITDADEFRENCLRRKQCALVIFDGNYTEAEAAAVKTVAAQYRGIAMAEMDSRKLRLSIEDALPPNKGEPRLVYLSLDTSTKDEKKKGDTTSKKKPELKYQGKAFKGARWDDKALADFLESVSSGGTKLAKLKTLPQVFDRKEEERAERKKKEKADKKSKKKESPYDHVKDDDSSTKKKVRRADKPPPRMQFDFRLPRRERARSWERECWPLILCFDMRLLNRGQRRKAQAPRRGGTESRPLRGQVAGRRHERCGHRKSRSKQNRRSGNGSGDGGSR